MEVAELAHLRRARDLLDREYARPLDVPAMARAALMSRQPPAAEPAACYARLRFRSPGGWSAVSAAGSFLLYQGLGRQIHLVPPRLESLASDE
jgi:hypothetical protein